VWQHEQAQVQCNNANQEEKVQASILMQVAALEGLIFEAKGWEGDV
jgi:hypothetical protein